jgi:hypothetical protein
VNDLQPTSVPSETERMVLLRGHERFPVDRYNWTSISHEALFLCLLHIANATSIDYLQCSEPVTSLPKREAMPANSPPPIAMKPPAMFRTHELNRPKTISMTTAIAPPRMAVFSTESIAVVTPVKSTGLEYEQRWVTQPMRL